MVGGWLREILAIFLLEILGELEISLNKELNEVEFSRELASWLRIQFGKILVLAKSTSEARRIFRLTHVHFPNEVRHELTPKGVLVSFRFADFLEPT